MTKLIEQISRESNQTLKLNPKSLRIKYNSPRSFFSPSRSKGIQIHLYAFEFTQKNQKTNRRIRDNVHMGGRDERKERESRKVGRREE